MDSPPHPEGSSHATGGILRGNAVGNTFAFADHDPTSHNDIVGHKKAVIRLYSSSLDPTVAHVNGVEGMGYTKVVVNYNYFLVPVLKDVAKKHPAIACKFIYLEWLYLTLILYLDDKIFVLDLDGIWEMKGAFSDACAVADDVAEYTVINDKPTLHILKVWSY